MRVVPVMTADELMVALAVDPDTPLLRGVLAVLAGMEEMEKDSVGRVMPDGERTLLCGRMSNCADAQERILELVERANKRKKGEE